MATRPVLQRGSYLESRFLIGFDPSKGDNRLHQLTNLLTIFTDFDSCRDFLDSLSKDDRVIFILTGHIESKQFDYIHQFRQVIVIYLYETEKDSSMIQSKKVKTIDGDFNEQSRRHLFNVHEPLSITTSDRSTSAINGHFVHSQLLIDCLLRMRAEPSELEEFIAFFRKEYHDNASTLIILAEFERDYRPDRALWWYTRESFLYRVLNKALRTQNSQLLYFFRFFIRDIQDQLEQNKSIVPLRIYRASLNRQIALFYLDESNLSDENEKILFELNLDSQLEDVKPFADITASSDFLVEQEVLIMAGSIFRFVNMCKENEIWILQMELCTNQDKHMKHLLEYMKQQHGNGETNLLSLGVILHEMGQFDEAEKYYHRLIKERSTDTELISACYHALGSVASEKGDYDTSLKWNDKSLDVRKRAAGLDLLNVAYNYNSIGVIYQKKNDYPQALRFYRKALIIWEKILGKNDPKVALCLNNMGGVYHAQEKYTEALVCHQHALTIWQMHLPEDSFDLGASHNNIGCIYGCLAQYRDAIEHFNESLKIYYKSLPEEHAAIAKTLENIGLVHYLTNNSDQALVYYEKAASMYRRTLPSTHPKLLKIEQDITCVLSGIMPSSFHFWWLNTLKVFPLKSCN